MVDPNLAGINRLHDDSGEMLLQRCLSEWRGGSACLSLCVLEHPIGSARVDQRTPDAQMRSRERLSR